MMLLVKGLAKPVSPCVAGWGMNEFKAGVQGVGPYSPYHTYYHYNTKKKKKSCVDKKKIYMYVSQVFLKIPSGNIIQNIVLWE